MTETTVAYPGEEGAYAAEAGAQLYPGRRIDGRAVVRRGDESGDQGRGRLRRAADRELAGRGGARDVRSAAHAPLAIVAETVLPVPHVLVGIAGANIDALVRVHSHPMALIQCRRFLSSLPDTLPEVAPSTSGAARRVSESKDPRQAAISSRRAAERFGLSVLLNDVSDHAQNYTRFVSVAPHTRLDRRDGEQWRCAIRFVTHHHPGALHDAIEPLRRFGVNMTSLQSRPIPGRPWEYQFYADLEGHPIEKSVGEALAAMQENVAELAHLGCYPAHPRL